MEIWWNPNILGKSHWLHVFFWLVLWSCKCHFLAVIPTGAGLTMHIFNTPYCVGVLLLLLGDFVHFLSWDSSTLGSSGAMPHNRCILGSRHGLGVRRENRALADSLGYVHSCREMKSSYGRTCFAKNGICGNPMLNKPGYPGWWNIYRGLLDFSDGKLFTGGLIHQIWNW